MISATSIMLAHNVSPCLRRLCLVADACLQEVTRIFRSCRIRFFFQDDLLCRPNIAMLGHDERLTVSSSVRATHASGRQFRRHESNLTFTIVSALSAHIFTGKMPNEERPCVFTHRGASRCFSRINDDIIIFCREYFHAVTFSRQSAIATAVPSHFLAGDYFLPFCKRLMVSYDSHG